MTMNSRRYLLAAVLALSFPVVILRAEVSVCPKCGYESRQGGKICGHCRAEIPETRQESAQAASELRYTLSGTGKLEFLSPHMIEEEIRQADRYVATGEVAVARLFFRNAIAMDLLTNPAKPNDQTARIVEFLKKMEKEGPRSRHSCSVCGGTGKGKMRVASLKGDVSYQDIPGKSCAQCGGSGFVNGPTTMDEWKFAAGRAAAQYAALQQSRKYVAVGGAWVPLDVEAKLSQRQIVLLRRASPPPCSVCMGCGRVDCVVCHGVGEIKCANKKCVQGIVTVETKTDLTKSTVSRSEKCKECHGKGMISCSECRGVGNLLCQSCNGAGELPLCKKCSGQGSSPCTRCHGAGVQKGAPCPTCGGEGIAICSMCNGDGRKK
jgi:hypothetical protein